KTAHRASPGDNGLAPITLSTISFSGHGSHRPAALSMTIATKAAASNAQYGRTSRHRPAGTTVDSETRPEAAGSCGSLGELGAMRGTAELTKGSPAVRAGGIAI